MKIQISTCALSIQFKPSGELQLLPWGQFRSVDTRPTDAEHWVLDEGNAQKVLRQIQSVENPMPIYYEHQDVRSVENGQPAPAAGWVDRSVIELRQGQGLFASSVKWTPRANDYLANGEYLYFSPLIRYTTPDGKIVDVINGSLVNEAGLDGMQSVSALAASHYEETDVMNKEELLKLLGLPSDAADSAIAERVSALDASASEADALRLKIEGLQTAKPDPAQYVPVKAFDALQDQVAKLRREQITSFLEANAAKLPTPELREWAEHYGETMGVAELKKRLSSMNAIPALDGGTQTGGVAPPEQADHSEDTEEGWVKHYEADAELKKEFGNVELYKTYRRAEKRGVMD